MPRLDSLIQAKAYNQVQVQTSSARLFISFSSFGLLVYKKVAGWPKRQSSRPNGFESLFLRGKTKRHEQ
jgi:hypothetical protein